MNGRMMRMSNQFKDITVTSDMEEAIERVKERIDIKQLISLNTDDQFPPSGDYDIIISMSEEEILYTWLGLAKVKKSFKDNDWVVCRLTNTLGIVDNVTYLGKEPSLIVRVPLKEVPWERTITGHMDDFRYANSREIISGKKIRWWSSHKRSVEELKYGDIIHHINDNVPRMVYSQNKKKTFIMDGDKLIPINNIWNEWRVITFCEDRVDSKF